MPKINHENNKVSHVKSARNYREGFKTVFIFPAHWPMKNLNDLSIDQSVFVNQLIFCYLLVHSTCCIVFVANFICCCYSFLNCYMAASRAILDHCWVDSLTNPTLITRFFICVCDRKFSSIRELEMPYLYINVTIRMDHSVMS